MDEHTPARDRHTTTSDSNSHNGSDGPAVVPGSDDLQAAHRGWALEQVRTGQLSVGEAIEVVPGAARLLTHAGDDRWTLTAEADAGPQPGKESGAWGAWFARVMEASPVHRAYERSELGSFEQHEAVWDQHRKVHELTEAGQLDPARVVYFDEGERDWLGIAGQTPDGLDYTAFTDDSDQAWPSASPQTVLADVDSDGL
jgi:hypothetical protein